MQLFVMVSLTTASIIHVATAVTPMLKVLKKLNFSICRCDLGFFHERIIKWTQHIGFLTLAGIMDVILNGLSI